MPGIVIVLSVVVVAATVGTMLKVKRERPAPLRAVIALYGFGLLAVLIVGGVMYRQALERDAQREYDTCVAGVRGREGVRDHLAHLYDTLAATVTAEEGRAFVADQRADLDKNLPERTLEDCGDRP